MLGIAKLLLQVVHVKRETLQVVSLAMTALMPIWGRDFHTKARFRCFKVVKISALSLWELMTKGCHCQEKARAQLWFENPADDFDGSDFETLKL
jgi:hypothetical protein